MQDMSGKHSNRRIQNSDVPRAGRVGAHGGAAERGRGELGANRTGCSEDKGGS